MISQRRTFDVCRLPLLGRDVVPYMLASEVTAYAVPKISLFMHCHFYQYFVPWSPSVWSLQFDSLLCKKLLIILWGIFDFSFAYQNPLQVQLNALTLQPVGVGVPWNLSFGSESSLLFEGDSNFGPYLFHLDLCNFVAVYLTFVQFILQLKLYLYIIVHFYKIRRI